LTSEGIEESGFPSTVLGSIEIVPQAGGEAADSDVPQINARSIAAAPIGTGHLFMFAPTARETPWR